MTNEQIILNYLKSLDEKHACKTACSIASSCKMSTLDAKHALSQLLSENLVAFKPNRIVRGALLWFAK